MVGRYIDMRGYGSDLSLIEEQALDTFLRSFNVPPDLIPIDIDERAALFRSVVSAKRALIVIDNVASVRQVRRLLPGSRRFGRAFQSQGDISRARECWDGALVIFGAVEDPRAEEVRALLDGSSD